MIDPVQAFPSAMERFAKVSPLRDGAYRHFVCPVHDDSRPSAYAYVHPESRMLVLKCYKGCRHKQIMDAVGLRRKDIHMESKGAIRWQTDSVYYYHHADRSIAFRVLRIHGYDGEERVTKRFVQQHPVDARNWEDGVEGIQKPLYKLPELIAETKDGSCARTIYFVEGEKKADLLISIGLTSTTLSGGCNAHLEPHHLPYLAGQRVVFCLDHDEYGVRWAEQILFVCCTSPSPPDSISIMRFEDLPRHGDIADWIESKQSEGVADEDIRHELLMRSFKLPKIKVGL